MTLKEGEFELLRSLITDMKTDTQLGLADLKQDMQTGHKTLDDGQERIWTRLGDDAKDHAKMSTTQEGRIARLEQAIDILKWAVGVCAGFVISLITFLMTHKL